MKYTIYLWHNKNLSQISEICPATWIKINLNVFGKGFLN